MRRSVHSFGILLALGLLPACSSALPDAHRIRFADWTESAAQKLPVLVEIQAGERIPLTLRMDGDLITSGKEPERVVLTAQRHFFLLITSRGPAGISFDGKSFARSSGKRGRLKAELRQVAGGPPEVDVLLEQFYGDGT